MHVDGAVVADPVVAPHAVEQLLARQGEALVAGQVGDQIELAGGQCDGLAAVAHLAPGYVDLVVVADGDDARAADAGNDDAIGLIDLRQHRLGHCGRHRCRCDGRHGRRRHRARP